MLFRSDCCRASRISLLDQFSHIALTIGVAIPALVLEGPVVRKTALLDVLQLGLTRINALLERGSQLDADFCHRSFRVLCGDGVLAIPAPGADASVDLGVVVSPRTRRKGGDGGCQQGNR